MISTVCHAISILFQLILYFALLFISLVIGLKLWLEPVKGVCRCKSRLDDKVVLITGGNSGIGLETARDLAKRGARVIIASRNDGKSKQAVEDIKATSGNANVEYRHLDLSKLRSIREFAEDFNKTVDRLDILVNNAACSVARGITEDGYNEVMQINYLGPFLLTTLLMEKLIESKPSRIVIVSSVAHILPYFDPEDLAGLNYLFFAIWFRYANSKLCNILWARALSNKLPRGVTANSLHPGVVNTNIFDNVPSVVRNLIQAVIKTGFFKTPSEGAQTTIHVSVCPDLENVSGEYFYDCKVTGVSRKARNSELVENIWNQSVTLVQSK